MGTFKSEIPNVYRHHNGHRFYLLVPADCRKVIGRTSWVHTFPRDTPERVVRVRAAALREKYWAMVRRVRDGLPVDDAAVSEAEETARAMMALPPSEREGWLSMVADQRPGDPPMAPDVAATVNAFQHGGQYQAPGMTVSEAYQRDLKHYAGKRSEKPILEARDSFKAVCGDVDLCEVSRDDVSRWIEAMRAGGQKDSSIRRRLGAMRALTGRLYRDRELQRRNPFSEHAVGGGASADDRLPFHRRHYEVLDQYLARSTRIGAETREIIALMRFTGMGPAEAGGLALADLQLDDLIPHLHVRANRFRNLKAGSRDRRLPLLGDALDAARTAVDRAQKRAGDRPAESVQLFDAFDASKGAASISARLSKVLRSAGATVKGGRLTPYSMRHAIAEALRESGSREHVQKRIMGHAAANTSERYGSRRARLEAAQAALVAAIEHLGDTDPGQYRANEWPKVADR